MRRKARVVHVKDLADDGLPGWNVHFAVSHIQHRQNRRLVMRDLGERPKTNLYRLAFLAFVRHNDN